MIAACRVWTADGGAEPVLVAAGIDDVLRLLHDVEDRLGVRWAQLPRVDPQTLEVGRAYVRP